MNKDLEGMKVEYYITYQKFLILYHSFLIWWHQFEVDWIKEKFSNFGLNITQERIQYCEDMLKKMEDREEGFRKIIFNFSSREYDVDGDLCIQLMNDEELTTVLMGNKDMEIKDGKVLKYEKEQYIIIK